MGMFIGSIKVTFYNVLRDNNRIFLEDDEDATFSPFSSTEDIQNT